MPPAPPAAPQHVASAAAAPAPLPAAAPASRSAAAQAADDPVIQALMRGLGIAELGSKRSAEEVAELAGAMLREATAGTMGVLMARAMTKRESRLEMTMISSQANNPLKFFPDADSALMQMMNASMPGYMQPVKAYANAFDDLKAHELAIMAGMRAALNGVLKRFDPAVIEQRLQVPTVMDKMLSSNRKAKMWDRMVELYQQMALEADEDFQRLFGETFGDAYEEQIARLQQGRR
jgi:type VI secretion system FHA domain protein